MNDPLLSTWSSSSTDIYSLIFIPILKTWALWGPLDIGAPYPLLPKGCPCYILTSFDDHLGDFYSLSETVLYKLYHCEKSAVGPPPSAANC